MASLVIIALVIAVAGEVLGLLAVGTAAVIVGSRSFAAIGQWAAGVGADGLAGLAGLGAARQRSSDIRHRLLWMAELNAA